MVQSLSMPQGSANSSVSKKPTKRVSVKRVTRKAPTPLKQRATDQKQLQKQLLAGIGIFVLIAFGSIGVGVADEGRINVTQVIEERNSRVVSGEEGGEGASVLRVPKQNTSQDSASPDGGLKGLGKSEKPPAPPTETASSTATSTDDGTASSTEDGTDEVSEEGEQESETATAEGDVEVTNEEEVPDEGIEG